MRYSANGFIPISEPPARRHITAAAVTIVKGDVLHDDGNGVATNATVAFAATCLGVASADCASGGDCEYFPLDKDTQYIVPVSQNAEIATTAIGTIVDLQANDDIDINDTVTEGIGFMIDKIDISDEAIAANTYGYAIGHFVVLGTQASSA
jgi:hypothetical protein